MIHSLAIENTLGSGGVVGDDPADHSAAGGSAGSGGIVQTFGSQEIVQIIPYEPGLYRYPTGFFIQLPDAIQVFGKINHQRFGDCLTGQAGPPPGKDGDFVFSGEGDCLPDFFFCFGKITATGITWYKLRVREYIPSE